MHMTSATTSANTPRQGETQHSPLISRQDTQEVLRVHWRKTIDDGLLERVHEAIKMLVDFALQVQSAQTVEGQAIGLDALISTLPYAARTFQRVLSFYEERGRLIKPNFDLVNLIEAAVGQFLPAHCHQVSNAIWNFDLNSLYVGFENIHLTHLEREYLVFATPLLISSVLWNAYPEDEIQENGLKNPFQPMWI